VVQNPRCVHTTVRNSARTVRLYIRYNTDSIIVFISVYYLNVYIFIDYITLYIYKATGGAGRAV